MYSLQKESYFSKNFEGKINLSAVALFFYRLAVVFIVFDGVRYFSELPQFVSQFKELAILVLFCIVLTKRRYIIDSKIIGRVGFILLFYLTFISSIIVLYNIEIEAFGIRSEDYYLFPLSVHYKNIQIFMMLYVFYYFEDLTGRSYIDLIKFFLILCIIYVVFSYVAYFYHFPFMRSFRPYVGRISNGYPTMDAQTLTFALAANLFLAPFRRSKYWIQFAILTILIVGIISQATGTGLVSIVCVISFYLFCSYIGKLPNKRTNIKILTLSFIIFVTASSVVVIQYYDLFKALINMVSRKYLAIINLGQNTTVDYSVQLRADQFENMMQIKNDLFDLIFGGGTYLGYQIENQYGFYLRSYGLIGVVLFISFLFYYLYLAIIKKIENKYLMICTVGIFLLTSYSLISTYLFSTAASFSLLIGYILSSKNRSSCNYKLLIFRRDKGI